MTLAFNIYRYKYPINVVDKKVKCRKNAVKSYRFNVIVHNLTA